MLHVRDLQLRLRQGWSEAAEVTELREHITCQIIDINYAYVQADHEALPEDLPVGADEHEEISPP